MTEVLSPAVAKILKVNIKPGQMITEDDKIFIIETTKMENSIFGNPGVVKEILVKSGDYVEEDQVLAIIE